MFWDRFVANTTRKNFNEYKNLTFNLLYFEISTWTKLIIYLSLQVERSETFAKHLREGDRNRKTLRLLSCYSRNDTFICIPVTIRPISDLFSLIDNAAIVLFLC